MHKITVRLGNMDDAIEQLDRYEKKVQQNVKDFLTKLLDEGVEIAKAKLVNLPPKAAVETGDLLASMKRDVIIEGNKGVILADNAHAVFVEFGTGVKGDNSKHPGMDIGKKSTKDRAALADGWWYFDEQQGRTRFTEGMPSRPFMYETARDLERKVGEIAREVFGR